MLCTSQKENRNLIAEAKKQYISFENGEDEADGIDKDADKGSKDAG